MSISRCKTSLGVNKIDNNQPEMIIITQTVNKMSYDLMSPGSWSQLQPAGSWNVMRIHAGMV